MVDITPRISPINAPKKTARQLIEAADIETPEVSTPEATDPMSTVSAPSVPEIKPVEARAPVAPQPAPQPVQSAGMHLFKDEQEAYQKMMDSGLDDSIATNMIKQRRADLMGGNTQLKQSEAAALLKMRESGLDAKTAIKLLNDKRQADEAERPAWKKAGEGALNFAAGNLQTIAQYGGNALDFLTGGKLGAGEDVKKMMEQNKKDFGDSAAFTAGTYAPDAAAIVAPGGALIKGGQAAARGAQAINAASKFSKAATMLSKSAAVGGAYGAVTPILDKGSEATSEDISTGAKIGAAAGAILPIAGKMVTGAAKKAAGYISKALPERLQLSGQLNRADLTNVSERLAKLTGKEAEPADAARWLLDREVKGSLEAQRAQVQGLTEKAHQQASKLLESKSGDVGNTKAADNLRKALSEKLEEYGSYDKAGNFVASAGNEAKAAAIQGAISNPSMTLKEMNDARRILAERLFTKMGSPKELSKLEGWQKVWKETSQFIEEKAPGFRKANKDVEVGMAINQAMLKKESAQQAQQMLAYLGVSGLGAGAGYYQGGDLESAAKGAAIVFGVGQLSKFLNSPAVKSRLAFALNKLSPAARKSIEQLKNGAEIAPGAIKLINSELKSVNFADLASDGKVSKNATRQSAKKVGKPKVAPNAPYMQQSKMPMGGKVVEIKNMKPGKEVAKTEFESALNQFRTAEDYANALEIDQKTGVSRINMELPTESLIPNGSLYDFKPNNSVIKANPKEPIVVKYDSDSDSFIVLDGHHRLSQALANGQKTLPVKVGFLKNGKAETITREQMVRDWNDAKVAKEVETPVLAKFNRQETNLQSAKEIGNVSESKNMQYQTVDLVEEAKKYDNAEDFVVSEVGKIAKKTGETSDGLLVRKHVPNEDSIEATFGNDYAELSGIRDIPASEFDFNKPTKRIKELASQIKQSGEINPLIAVYDGEGFYILEGSHRIHALGALGKKTIPARVIVDTQKLPKYAMTDIWRKAHNK